MYQMRALIHCLPYRANPFPPMINFIVAGDIIILLFCSVWVQGLGLICNSAWVSLLLGSTCSPGLHGNKIPGTRFSRQNPKHHSKARLLWQHNALPDSGSQWIIAQLQRWKIRMYQTWNITSNITVQSTQLIIIYTD